MSNFLKTTITAIVIAVASSASAQAADYKLKLRWDNTQTIEQNYHNISDKVEFYCKIQVRRDVTLYRSADKSLAIEHCQAQLMKAYVEQADDKVLTQYFAARSHLSNGGGQQKVKLRFHPTK